MSGHSGGAPAVNRVAGQLKGALEVAVRDSASLSLKVVTRVSLGDVEAIVPREGVFDLLRLLKESPSLRFDVLLSVTAVDWLDSRPDRFEVVYHLLSIPHLYRLRVKTPVPEHDPRVDSATPLWHSADFLERECWDMYGIVFNGHPDLRRILMYDEFVGHPLRKDYPVQGKQPRIPLRAPEVRNTATDMQRSPLVAISPRRKVAGVESPGGLITEVR